MIKIESDIAKGRAVIEVEGKTVDILHELTIATIGALRNIKLRRKDSERYLSSAEKVMEFAKHLSLKALELNEEERNERRK